jgi:hypothetical protein
MKKPLIIFLILSCSDTFALDAVITVLEAPVFRTKSLKGKIVQYLRKGDVIKIHSAVGKNEIYDHISPDPERIDSIKKEMIEKGEFQDPFFSNTFHEPINRDDTFIPFIDKSGSLAYVLSNHLYVYYEDKREFSESEITFDETDYRLKEPLPPNYPLSQKTGYRGQAILGFSQPYTESYPYPDSIKTKGYSSPVELYLSFLNQPRHEARDRFYFGPSLRFRRFENTFFFFDKRESQEIYYEFSLGPSIQFDAYKGEKNRLNLAFNIHFQPWNFLKITQSDANESESRTYRGYGFSSRLGIYYHRKSISENLDFIIGSSLDLDLPLSYQAQSGAGNTSWWQKLGGEKFRPKSSFGVTTALGIQAAY